MAEPDSLTNSARGRCAWRTCGACIAVPSPRSSIAAALAAVEQAHAVTAQLAAADAPAYGINTGFGLLAQTRIPAEQRALLQKQHHALPQRGRRAAAGRRHRAPEPGAEAREPAARLLRGERPAGAGFLAGADQPGAVSVRAGAGLGGRLRRSCAAGAPVAPVLGLGHRSPGRGDPAAEALASERPDAAGARAEGRSRAAQRHAGLHRAGARRRVRAGRGICRGDGERALRHWTRCRAATRRSIRASTSCAATRARPDVARVLPRAARGKRRSASRIAPATACRTRTPCAASRR